MQAFCAESSLCDLYQKGVHSFHSTGHPYIFLFGNIMIRHTDCQTCHGDLF